MRRKVKEFWAWFAEHELCLAERLEARDAAFIGELTARIKQIHPQLGWELGPPLEKVRSFTITPNGVRALLSLTDAVVREAPTLPAWEFHAAKQPKQWDMQFMMRNSRKQQVQIDARDWCYALTAYPNEGFFDVTLVAPTVRFLDLAAKRQAAYIVIDSILGERLAIERIGVVEILSQEEVPKELSNRLTHIRHLAKHMARFE